MPTAATHSYSLRGITPAFPGPVVEILGKLYAGVAGQYPKGTILGEVTGTNNIQSIAINATGGTFTLTLRGVTTAAIAWNATAKQIQTILNKILAVQTDGGSVIVTGGGTNLGSFYLVEFVGAYNGKPVATAPDTTLTTSGASLTGGAGTSTIVLTVQVGAPVTEQVTGTIAAPATLGYYKAYGPGNTDGSQRPVGILKYGVDITTDGKLVYQDITATDVASQAAITGGDQGESSLVTPILVSGYFYTADLNEWTANATRINAPSDSFWRDNPSWSLIQGTMAAGIVRIG